MPRKLVVQRSDVQLWRITHPADETVEAFVVADPRRTPEDWGFDNLRDAAAKFDERVENAKTEPPVR